MQLIPPGIQLNLVNLISVHARFDTWKGQDVNGLHHSASESRDGRSLSTWFDLGPEEDHNIGADGSFPLRNRAGYVLKPKTRLRLAIVSSHRPSHRLFVNVGMIYNHCSNAPNSRATRD